MAAEEQTEPTHGESHSDDASLFGELLSDDAFYFGRQLFVGEIGQIDLLNYFRTETLMGKIKILGFLHQLCADFENRLQAEVNDMTTVYEEHLRLVDAIRNHPHSKE
jgi:hypothetical protein